MPMDYEKYPSNWKEISDHVRFERAAGKCEWCGVEHGAIGARAISGEWYGEGSIHLLNSDDCYELFGDKFPKMIKIILTTAHLGIDKPDGTHGDKRDKSDCRLENLAALCQKCHLNYDRDEHIENMRETVYQKRLKSRKGKGYILLPGFEDVLKLTDSTPADTSRRRAK